MNNADIKTIRNCLVFFVVIWVILLLWAFGSWAWEKYKASKAESEDAGATPQRATVQAAAIAK